MAVQLRILEGCHNIDRKDTQHCYNEHTGTQRYYNVHTDTQHYNNEHTGTQLYYKERTGTQHNKINGMKISIT